LATNPIFPLAAIEERARWAGFDSGTFDMVTSYETARATKPSPMYFLDIAAHLGLDPHECLMVGDDRDLDLPAAEVGMQTFYVGRDPDAADGASGSLLDLVGRLSELSA
jgi:FMN phosphatase YigB (HAD superfamily)